jgi:hypothetical protein
MRHLTHTGQYAGWSLCRKPKSEYGEGWHAVWLTDQQMSDYRASAGHCPECLAFWDSLDDTEPATEPAEQIGFWESTHEPRASRA